MSEVKTPSVETPIRILFFDTDCAGVVHNIAYLRFIETARTELAEELGWKLEDMTGGGACPVVLRTEIDYRKPARLADRLIVRGWLERVERMRFWCAFEIMRPSDGTLISTCRQSLALVQPPEMKLIRLPSDWREKYAHLV